ncbi:hypothetical protein QYF36_015860 [Acer negundo]|nr:hypothetical protein QYF36_015860 [Acer negundo]
MKEGGRRLDDVRRREREERVKRWQRRKRKRDDRVNKRRRRCGREGDHAGGCQRWKVAEFGEVEIRAIRWRSGFDVGGFVLMIEEYGFCDDESEFVAVLIIFF